jgi:putative nucleotidyltransferase with HDIG domain
MTLEPWAKSQAEDLMAPLGDRWLHVQAVANQACRVGLVLVDEDRDVLVAAAYLHDIGYAPSLNRLGFHPIDGARFLRQHGHERLARLVAHHSGARFEAEERGLLNELAAFSVEDGPVLDSLTFADMTTGPAGESMTLQERIGEILRRYPPDDPVYRAIRRAQPLLQAAVDRTLDRLGGVSGQPM